MKKREKAFVVVLLVLTMAMSGMLSGCFGNGSNNENQNPSDASGETAGGTTASTAAATSEPTAAPTTEATTAPTTEPTTAPTTEPTTAPTTEPETEPATEPTAATVAPGSVVGSGSFTSDTGTALKLIVDWEATAKEDGAVEIKLTGTVESYSLQVLPQPVTVKYAGYTATAMGKTIQIEKDGTVTTSDLFTATLEVPAGTSGTMEVVWNYSGVYSGVELPTITASGEVG